MSSTDGSTPVIDRARAAAPTTADRRTKRRSASMFDRAILARAIPDSFRKLDPAPDGPQPGHVRGRGRQRPDDDPGDPRHRRLRRAGRDLAVVHGAVRQLRRGGGRGPGQGPGRHAAQDPLRDRGPRAAGRRRDDREGRRAQLQVGDLCVVEAGELIPGDGEIVDGIASVDESAITGESAPVIRESGGDRSAVTGGTRVLSDRIVVRITSKPGETFLDRMIALVEGASRQKTPNEIALNILLAGLTIIFLLAVVTLQPFAIYSDAEQSITVLVALLVCLIPTTIGALLSAIGIAGMDRLVQRNVLAMSGRAVEAAGDCNTLLLDKTGTITLGNRQAAEFLPLPGVDRGTSWPRPPSCRAWPTRRPEGRSIVVLAKERFDLRGRDLHDAELIPFTAQTRMSRRRPRRADAPQGRDRLGQALGAGAGRDRPGRARPDRRAHRQSRRNAAGRRRGHAGARRGPPQGRREGGHRASGSPSCGAWASAR